jgi:hypothetical protein
MSQNATFTYAMGPAPDPSGPELDPRMLVIVDVMVRGGPEGWTQTGPRSFRCTSATDRDDAQVLLKVSRVLRDGRFDGLTETKR